MKVARLFIFEEEVWHPQFIEQFIVQSQSTAKQKEAWLLREFLPNRKGKQRILRKQRILNE